MCILDGIKGGGSRRFMRRTQSATVSLREKDKLVIDSYRRRRDIRLLSTLHGYVLS